MIQSSHFTNWPIHYGPSNHSSDFAKLSNWFVTVSYSLNYPPYSWTVKLVYKQHNKLLDRYGFLYSLVSQCFCNQRTPTIPLLCFFLAGAPTTRPSIRGKRSSYYYTEYTNDELFNRIRLQFYYQGAATLAGVALSVYFIYVVYEYCRELKKAEVKPFLKGRGNGQLGSVDE